MPCTIVVGLLGQSHICAKAYDSLHCMAPLRQDDLDQISTVHMPSRFEHKKSWFGGFRHEY